MANRTKLTNVDASDAVDKGISIYEKLFSIQQKLKAPKDQYNSFAKYSYRSAEQILEAVKPLLNDSRVVLTISDEVVNAAERYYIKATVTLSDVDNVGDTVSTSALAREAEEQKGMVDGQLSGSTSSFARKYALCGLFALDDNKDLDSMDNRQSGQRTKPPVQDKKAILVAIYQDMKSKGYGPTREEVSAYLNDLVGNMYEGSNLNTITREQAAVLRTKVLSLPSLSQ